MKTNPETTLNDGAAPGGGGETPRLFRYTLLVGFSGSMDAGLRTPQPERVTTGLDDDDAWRRPSKGSAGRRRSILIGFRVVGVGAISCRFPPPTTLHLS